MKYRFVQENKRRERDISYQNSREIEHKTRQSEGCQKECDTDSAGRRKRIEAPKGWLTTQEDNQGIEYRRTYGISKSGKFNKDIW